MSDTKSAALSYANQGFRIARLPWRVKSWLFKNFARESFYDATKINEQWPNTPCSLGLGHHRLISLVSEPEVWQAGCSARGKTSTPDTWSYEILPDSKSSRPLWIFIFKGSTYPGELRDVFYRSRKPFLDGRQGVYHERNITLTRHKTRPLLIPPGRIDEGWHSGTLEWMSGGSDASGIMEFSDWR